MPRSLKHLFQQMPRFILLGIAIAFVIGIFILFSYVFVWGLMIGGILWGIHTISQYARTFTQNKKQKPAKGRIIEHDKY